MFNTERNINARLTVVPMDGWMRGDWYDSTGLPWINPSPNMRSLTEATLYPGVGLVEGTNVSVGRGTDTPFELLGAPWIKAQRTGAIPERQKHFRRALRTHYLHSQRQQLFRPEVRRRQYFRGRAQRSRRGRTGH